MKVLEIKMPEYPEHTISEYQANQLKIIHGCDFAITMFIYHPYDNMEYPLCIVREYPELDADAVQKKLKDNEPPKLSKEELERIYNKFKPKKHWWQIWKQ